MENIENKSVLDDLKKIEEQKKKNLLIKSLNKLKEKAREVMTIKEETNAILNNLWLSTKEQKQIIDWINSLDDVQLSNDDRKEIADEMKEEMKEEKEVINKKTEEIWGSNPFIWSVTTTGNYNWNALTVCSNTAKNAIYNTWATLVSTSIWWLAYKQWQFEVN